MNAAWRACLVLSMLWLAGCGAETSPLTQLVVEVDSDLRVPDDIDRVTVLVEQAQATEASADLTRTPLPRTLGMVHTGGPLGPFTLRAVGWKKSQRVVETALSASFEQGKSVHVALVLESACQGVRCGAGESCVAARCEPVNGGADASSDPGDGGVSDGATDPGPTEAGALPTCSITSPVAGDTVQRGVSFAVQGSCRSDVGASLTQGLSWRSDVDGVLGAGANTSVTLTTLGPQSLSLCATAPTDPNLMACTQVALSVASSVQPSVAITSVVQGNTARSPYQTGAPIVLSGTGSGAGVTLSWNDTMQGGLQAGAMATLDAPLPGKHTVTLTASDRNGRKASATTTFVVLAPGQSSLVEPIAGTNAVLNGAVDLVERTTGVVYVPGSDGRLYSLSVSAGANEAPQLVLDRPPLQGSVHDLLLDSANGLLYLGTSNGLTVCLHTAQSGPTDCTMYQGGQLPSDDVRSVLRMPQSSGADLLLVGTEQGLLVSDNPAGSTSGAVKLNERAIRAMVGDRNLSWLATDQGLYRYTGGSSSAARVTSSASSNTGWNAVALGAGGVLWLGGSSGLARYNPNTDAWSLWKAADGLASNAVTSLALEMQVIDGMAHDVLWIGTSAGVSRFDVQFGTFQTFTTADGLPSNSVTKVLVLGNGTKVFATDAGIARYTGR